MGLWAGAGGPKPSHEKLVDALRLALLAAVEADRLLSSQVRYIASHTANVGDY